MKAVKRKELLAVPKRKWDRELVKVHHVYIIPSRRKHDSGYACMDMVAVLEDGEEVGIGGGCDVVSLMGSHFRIDCEHPSGIIRVFNISKEGFSITRDLSSIDFIEGKLTDYMKWVRMGEL